MRAADLMTTEVVTVDTASTVKEAADLMLKCRVSGLPVLDAHGNLAGIVSEGDLIRRTELGTERKRGALSRFFTDAEILANEYVRSHTTKVADVMTMAVITARPEMKLGAVADLMETHRIRRVPIVDKNRLVGIVSRRDLVRALSGAAPQLVAKSMMDNMIRDAIYGEIGRQPWAHKSEFVIDVHAGKVAMRGIVASEAQRKAALLLAETVPGVQTVEDRIGVMPVEVMPV